MSTKKSTRIAIWVIVIVMTVGFVGSFFITAIQNDERDQSIMQSQKNNESQEKAIVDPTAYKVTGDVKELIKEDLVVGKGEEVKPGANIKVHYKGTIAQTGVKFDSSYDRGEPIDLSLSGVIKGWVEGVPGMKVGGKRRLIIPSELGYGAQGSADIPANSDLVFEIELLAINVGR